MTQVRCYHTYFRDKDEYGDHHDLCEECFSGFTLDENTSLHDSGPTNRSCEACGEGNDGQ